MADSLHRDNAEAANTPVMGEDLCDMEIGNTDFENLIQNYVDPVFEGCTENRLQCGIVLMTLASVYGVSDDFLTALLSYLAGTLLPRSNSLPRSAYELKTMIRRLGLEHERIDSCPEGHILFEGDVNGGLEQCPVCIHVTFLI